MTLPSVPLQGAAPEKGAWFNQRATVRYQCAPATSGQVYSSEDLQYQRAWLLDLSTTGAGLQMTRPPAAGTPVTVQIKSPTTGQKFEMSAQVVHVTLQANGDFIVGCEFLSQLTHDDLEALL